MTDLPTKILQAWHAAPHTTRFLESDVQRATRVCEMLAEDASRYLINRVYGAPPYVMEAVSPKPARTSEAPSREDGTGLGALSPSGTSEMPPNYGVGDRGSYGEAMSAAAADYWRKYRSWRRGDAGKDRSGTDAVGSRDTPRFRGVMVEYEPELGYELFPTHLAPVSHAESVADTIDEQDAGRVESAARSERQDLKQTPGCLSVGSDGSTPSRISENSQQPASPAPLVGAPLPEWPKRMTFRQIKYVDDHNGEVVWSHEAESWRDAALSRIASDGAEIERLKRQCAKYEERIGVYLDDYADLKAEKESLESTHSAQVAAMEAERAGTKRIVAGLTGEALWEALRAEWDTPEPWVESLHREKYDRAAMRLRGETPPPRVDRSEWWRTGSYAGELSRAASPPEPNTAQNTPVGAKGATSTAQDPASEVVCSNQTTGANSPVECVAGSGLKPESVDTRPLIGRGDKVPTLEDVASAMFYANNPNAEGDEWNLEGKRSREMRRSYRNCARVAIEMIEGTGSHRAAWNHRSPSSVPGAGERSPKCPYCGAWCTPQSWRWHTETCSEATANKSAAPLPSSAAWTEEQQQGALDIFTASMGCGRYASLDRMDAVCAEIARVAPLFAHAAAAMDVEACATDAMIALADRLNDMDGGDSVLDLAPESDRFIDEMRKINMGTHVLVKKHSRPAAAAVTREQLVSTVARTWDEWRHDASDMQRIDERIADAVLDLLTSQAAARKSGEGAKQS